MSDTSVCQTCNLGQLRGITYTACPTEKDYHAYLDRENRRQKYTDGPSANLLFTVTDDFVKGNSIRQTYDHNDKECPSVAEWLIKDRRAIRLYSYRNNA